MLRKSLPFWWVRLHSLIVHRIKNLEAELEQMQGSVQRSHGRR